MAEETLRLESETTSVSLLDNWNDSTVLIAGATVAKGGGGGDGLLGFITQAQVVVNGTGECFSYYERDGIGCRCYGQVFLDAMKSVATRFSFIVKC